ncbi:MAG: hypothetical protein M3O50_02740, partial [Myxococcota bacterium]|nr:hypothetical protein [Myxococcota bacterium]
LEVGDEVPIYMAPTADAGPPVIVLPDERSDLTGLELLREVAIARIAGPPHARIRIDWTRCGLELAQIALTFGANELVGRVASKRGLPLAAGELAGVGKKSALLPAQRVKQRELAGLVRRAGRSPIFVRADGSPEPADIIPSLKEAQ